MFSLNWQHFWTVIYFLSEISINYVTYYNMLYKLKIYDINKNSIFFHKNPPSGLEPSSVRFPGLHGNDGWKHGLLLYNYLKKNINISKRALRAGSFRGLARALG